MADYGDDGYNSWATGYPWSGVAPTYNGGGTGDGLALGPVTDPSQLPPLPPMGPAPEVAAPPPPQEIDFTQAEADAIPPLPPPAEEHVPSALAAKANEWSDYRVEPADMLRDEGVPSQDPNEIQMEGEPAPQLTEEQEAERLAADPEAMIRKQDEWAQFQESRLQEEQRKTDFQRERNFKIDQEARVKAQADTEAINADAIKLSQAKIDPKRWWKNASTGQHIGAAISAIVGGLVAGRTGGPNTGIQFLQGLIDQDIDAQKTDLANQQQMLGMRRGIVGEQYRLHGDAFRATEAARMASYDMAIGEVATSMQQWDPKSAKVMRLAKIKTGLEQARAQSAQAVADYNLKRATDEATLEGKQLDNLQKRGKLSGGGVAKPVVTIPRAEFKRRFGVDPGQDVPEKEIDKHLERAKKVRDLGGLDREQSVGGYKEVGPDGKVTAQRFTQDDGSVWNPSKEDTPKLKTSAVAVKKAIRGLRQIQELHKDEGGAGRFSDANFAYRKAVNKLVFDVAAANGWSTSDEQSFNAARDAILGGDPSSFNTGDVQKLLEGSIEDLKLGHIDLAEKAGYTGDPSKLMQGIEPPQAASKETGIDEMAKAAQASYGAESHNVAGAIIPGFNQLQGKDAAEGAKLRMAEIDKMANMAIHYNNRAALGTLKQLAKTGDTEAIREYAKRALIRVGPGAVGPNE